MKGHKTRGHPHHGIGAAKLAPEGLVLADRGALRLGRHSARVLCGLSSSVRARGSEWWRKSSARWHGKSIVLVGDPRFEGGRGAADRNPAPPRCDGEAAGVANAGAPEGRRADRKEGQRAAQGNTRNCRNFAPLPDQELAAANAATSATAYGGGCGCQCPPTLNALCPASSIAGSMNLNRAARPPLR
jgi:hypothetical protein